MELFIHGIGVCAPGLPDWPGACEVLLQHTTYSESPLPQPEPTFLPPNELRRSSDVVKWSLHVAQEALHYGKIKSSEVATVFASSGGETGILHQLCLALAKPDRIISPTLFHHSVHNAASGYWTIGAESQQPSVSLACFDSSFCSGLLETATMLQAEQTPVLFVVYDLAPPPPLYAARPLIAPFATAFLVGSQQLPHSLAHLLIQLIQPRGEETKMKEPLIEGLRKGNPAARALPLLQAIATGGTASVLLNYLDHHQLIIDVTTCQSCQN
jgi:hypothetical protein